MTGELRRRSGAMRAASLALTPPRPRSFWPHRGHCDFSSSLSMRGAADPSRRGQWLMAFG